MTDKQEPILRLRGVTKSFGPVEVLKGIDFEAYPGEVTALVGDNGAGKSTLVKCIGGTYSIDGRESLVKSTRTLDEAEMEHQAGEALASLSVRTVKSVRQKVSSLSGGQRQTVAIAKAVLWNSKVVILDEPTAALGVAQTAEVLRLVRNLADQGLAVILISHNMNDVLQVSDRIAALYLGQMAAQVKRAEVTHTQIVELIT